MNCLCKQVLFTSLLATFVVTPLPSLAQQDHSGHGSGNDQSMQHGDSGGGGGMRMRGQDGDGDNTQGRGMGNRDGGGGGMMRRGMQRMANRMGGDEGPATVGQSAYAVIREVVNTLQADPDTDWSQINIEALRRHLIDMDRVTLYAEAQTSEIPGGARYLVAGDDDRTIAAIQRMIPTHAIQIERELAWDTSTRLTENGVELTVQANDPAQTVLIRGLGFMGFMVQGEHHADHHLMMAGGSPNSDSGMMDHMMGAMEDMMDEMDHSESESDAMAADDDHSGNHNGHSGGHH